MSVTGPIRDPTIRDSTVTDLNQPQAIKLAGLKPSTKYRIILTASTAAGKGERGIVEASTGSNMTEHALALLPPPGLPGAIISGKTNESVIFTWAPQAAVSFFST